MKIVDVNMKKTSEEAVAKHRRQDSTSLKK